MANMLKFTKTFIDAMRPNLYVLFYIDGVL